MWIKSAKIVLAIAGFSRALDDSQVDLASSIATTLGPRCPFIPIGLLSADIEHLTSSGNPVLMGFPHSTEIEVAKQLLYTSTGCALVIAQNLTEPSILETLLSKITYGLILTFNDLHGRNNLGNSYLIDNMIIAKRIDRESFLLEMPCILSPKPTTKLFWRVQDKVNVPQHICSKTLRGHSVNVSIFAAFPYTIYNQGDHSFDGSDVKIIDIISRKIGFSYTLFNDQTWIRDEQTGAWGGMVGKILSGKRQFGLGPFGLNRPDHNLPLDFAAYLYTLEIIFFSPKPKPLSPFLNFLKPFSPLTWICIAAALILGSFSSFFIESIVSNGQGHTFGYHLFHIFATLSSQAIQSFSHKSAYSLFFIFWLCFVIFLNFSYDCNLRAYIIRVDYEKPIDNDLDLINADRDLYIPHGVGAEIAYKLSPVPLKQKIYQRSHERGTIFHYDRGRMDPKDEQRMIREGGALLYIKARASAGLAQVEKKYGYQPLRMGKDVVVEVRCGYMIPMFKPWKEEISVLLMHIFDSGIVEHWIKSYIPLNKYSFDVEKRAPPPPSAFQIDHIVGPLLVLLGGLVFSSLVFALEAFQFQTYS